MSNKKSIFLVEDDPDLRNLYQKILNLKEFHVIAAAKDGIEAVKMYRNFKKKPEIILMDYHMPQRNGLQAAYEILELNGGVQIFIMSGDFTIQEEVESHPGLKFILKPSNVGDLVAFLKKA